MMRSTCKAGRSSGHEACLGKVVLDGWGVDCVQCGEVRNAELRISQKGRSGPDQGGLGTLSVGYEPRVCEQSW